MDEQSLPTLPFEKKTKKWGTVQVIAIEPSDKGGLLQIDDGDHAPLWVRARDALGQDFFLKNGRAYVDIRP